jgi:superfamily I DNA/RNA helicase
MFPLNATPTKSQSLVLESKPNLIVYGPAGSGKTLLTILLAKKVKDENPDFKIEIRVFTKSLSKFIKQALEQRKIYDIEVSHYIDINKSYEEVDITIVDEGQDFYLDQILWISNRSKNGIYLLGDTNQDVYEFNKDGIRFHEVNKELHFNEIYLDEVLRFTPSIDVFIKNIFPNIKNIIPKNFYHDTKPKLYRCSDFKDQALKIKSFLEITPIGTTAILVMTNNEVLTIKEKLNSVGLLINGFKHKTDDYLSTKENALNILTYHSAKGLEFDNIIMPNLEQGNNTNNNIYYVGFSRAKKNLALFYLNQFPLWIKISDSKVFDGELYRDMDNLMKICLMDLDIYIMQIKMWTDSDFSIDHAKKQLGRDETEIINESIIGLIDIGYNESEANMIVIERLKQIH